MDLELVDTNLVPHPTMFQRRHLLRQMWRALPGRRGPPLHLLLLQILEDHQLGDEFEAQVRPMCTEEMCSWDGTDPFFMDGPLEVDLGASQSVHERCISIMGGT